MRRHSRASIHREPLAPPRGEGTDMEEDGGTASSLRDVTVVTFSRLADALIQRETIKVHCKKGDVGGARREGEGEGVEDYRLL